MNLWRLIDRFIKRLTMRRLKPLSDTTAYGIAGDDIKEGDPVFRDKDGRWRKWIRPGGETKQ